MLIHLEGSFTNNGLQPLVECYWKIACLRHAIFRGTPGNLRAASLRSLLTSGLLFGGSKCLSSRKKVSVLHLSVCSFGDQSSQLILCLDRIYIFLDLDCPASAGQLLDLGWTFQISENENFLPTKKLCYRALSPLSTLFFVV